MLLLPPESGLYTTDYLNRYPLTDCQKMILLNIRNNNKDDFNAEMPFKEIIWRKQT